MNVGAVNGHMAPGAALIVRIGHAVRGMVRIRNTAVRSDTEVAVTRVALQAKHRDRGPGEQFGILGPVWPVASDAALHFPGLVFEDERPALVHVTLDTGLVVAVGLVEHLGGLSHAERGGKAAVRVMAIGAHHEPFVHTVFGGQVELRPHVRVAFVAGVGLALSEQVLVGYGMVIGVAGGAGDIVLGMLGAADVSAIKVGGMAFEARGDDLLRLHDGKRIDNGAAAAAGRDVGFGRAMASLAGRKLRRHLTGGKAFEVRILVERGPDSGMAGLALRIAGVCRVGRDNRTSLRRGLGIGAIVVRLSRGRHALVRPRGLAGKTSGGDRTKQRKLDNQPT